MKLAMREHTDITAGIEGEVAVSFATNAVSFYAQITGLAKDKIGYPIRELCTNAWDIARGDFEVHLPTHLNPVFRVRDYGTGMSKEDMFGRFSKMYESDKRESDQAVGGWGIGRFSPFAYLIGESGAGQYTIVSYNGGKAATYIMSLNAQGSPMLRLLAEQATNARAGLEVSFPVRRDDVAQFGRRAREILWSFSPRPTVFPEINWEELESAPMQAGGNWEWHNRNDVSWRGPHVQMGCVMYPFELQQVEANSFLQSDDCVLFKAPIGSVQMSLSREYLAYDELTKRTLTRLVQDFADGLQSIVQAKVSEAESYFEACKIFQDETNYLGNHRQNLLRELVKWDNYKLSDAISSDDRIKFMQLGKGWDLLDSFGRQTVYPPRLVGAKVIVEHHPLYSKERLAEGGFTGEKLLWVRCHRDDLDEAMRMIGNPDYTVLDDIKLPKKESQRKDKTKKIRVRNTIEFSTLGFEKVRQEVDLLGGGVCVRYNVSSRSRYTSYGVSMSANIRISMQSFDVFLATVRRLDLFPAGQVVLILGPEEEVQSDNWTWMGEGLIEKLQAKIELEAAANSKLKGEYQIDQHLRAVARARFDRTLAPEDIQSICTEYSTLVQVIANRKDASHDSQTSFALNAFNAIGVQPTIPTSEDPVDILNVKWAEVSRRYPLLRRLASGNSYYDASTEQLNHYFNLLSIKEKFDAAADHNG